MAFLSFAAAERPDARARIEQEIARVERGWSEIAIAAASPLAGPASSSRKSLQAARDALAHGRQYAALESLAQAGDLLGGVREFAAMSESVKDAEAFDAEWKKADAALKGFARSAAAVRWDRSPAALRALAEASSGRSLPLLDGAHGFAVSTTPRDGLFYLGEARAQAEFANFCASLPLRAAGRPWAARSLLAELLALQQKVDAAFAPPRSIDQHTRFIALNSTLKLARELDADRSYFGALYQYLEAVRHFAMLDAPAVDAAGRKSLMAALAAEQKKLSRSGRDDSIPQLFLERAEQAQEPDEFRSAAVTVASVLLAYAAVLDSVPVVPSAQNKAIELTLVRWPYT